MGDSLGCVLLTTDERFIRSKTMKRDDDQRPSDEPKKLTGAELKRMIEKVLEDYQLLTPLPLDAEPPEDDPTQDPPEDTKQFLEES